MLTVRDLAQMLDHSILEGLRRRREESGLASAR